MKQAIYEGSVGLARLKAHMCVAYAERRQGTGAGWSKDYFIGLLSGLAMTEAMSPDISLAAHKFVAELGYEQAAA